MNLGRILQIFACPAPTRSPEWARRQYCLEPWATRSLSQARALEDLVPALLQPRPVPEVRSLCQGDMPPEPGPSLCSPRSGLVPCLNGTEPALASQARHVCPPLMEERGGGQSLDTQSGRPHSCM